MKMRTLTGEKCLSLLMNEFSKAVLEGHHNKMPYDAFRRVAKYAGSTFHIRLTDDTISINDPVLENANGIPYVVYQGNINDNSFGSFLHQKYFKETEETMITNTIQADNAYSLTGNSSITGSSSSNWYDSISTTSASIKSWTEINRDEIERLNKEVEDLKVAVAQKTDIEAVHASTQEAIDFALNVEDTAYYAKETALDAIQCIDHIDDTLYKMQERIAELENPEYLDKINATIAGMVSRIKTLEDLNTGGVHTIPSGQFIEQATSSDCYPVKNFKLNVAAWDTPCSDNRKEKESMDTNKMFNFDFGPVASHIRMSPYGLAIKSADNKFVSYDKASGSVVDVEVFNFDAQKFLYKMPVPISQVAVGDVVVHMRKPMFVREVKGNVVSVVDIYNAEAKDILPVKSPFGFNFITKIVSLIDMSGANAETPFGNMLPLLMMGEGQDFKDILPLMLMTGNTGAFGNMNQNSLLWFAMMSDKGNMSDLLPFMFMMGNNPFSPATPTHTCGCGHHKEENHQ